MARPITPGAERLFIESFKFIHRRVSVGVRLKVCEETFLLNTLGQDNCAAYYLLPDR
jgi:hypothetical protein